MSSLPNRAARRIHEFRHERKWSLQRMADFLGMPRQTLASYEIRGKVPQGRNAVALLDRNVCRMDDFYAPDPGPDQSLQRAG